MSNDQQAEVERLTGELAEQVRLSQRLADQIVRMSDRLEESRRELLAQGWDAAVDEFDKLSNGLGKFTLQRRIREANPYRKPVQL